MSGPAPADLLELAVAVAEEAGHLLLGFAGQRADGVDLDVTTKSSATDPVSEADRAAERLIAQRLASARPDDGLLAEEGQAARAGSSGLRWVVDPLDGTVNFLYGLPSWAVSIACEDAEGVVVGVVRDPQRDETFGAVRGAGAHLGDRALEVNVVADLAHALVATGFAYDPMVRAVQGGDVADLLPRVRDVRRCGSAAIDLAWCAAGKVDGYVEFGLNRWDWAAGRLLVEEAGGTVSSYQRQVAGRDAPGLVAGGAVVHDALLTWARERP